MALNDTFKILPKKIINSGDFLTSKFGIEDYWEKECRENPSKKRMSFLLRLNLLFLRKFVNFVN